MDPHQTTPAAVARRLIRACDRATLATALVDGDWPYASLVIVACDHGAAPLLLLSDLAEHTKNIAREPRASLLFDGTAGLDNPLTGSRVTVLGQLERCTDPGLIERFVRRHPDAELYASFADFNLFRMSVQRAHIVAGFGAIHRLDAADVLFDTSAMDSLRDSEADIVDHMNEDHADAVGLYAATLLGLPADGWSMTGVDPEGCDLRSSGDVARLEFGRPVADAEAARTELVRLVKAARRASDDRSR